MTESALREELHTLPESLQRRLAASGFDGERLVRLAAPLFARARGESTRDKEERNQVRGHVEAPEQGDIDAAALVGSVEHAQAEATGFDAIRRGELALCVMAGGMATRMGGVVKALVPALHVHGHQGDEARTFLDLRLAENATWSERAGHPLPLWLMTSEATEGPIHQALTAARQGSHVATFTQDLGLRLTREGRLFRGDDGEPSTYATGHGDLPDALRRSGLLASFVKQGGKFVWIANLDNLGATIDAALLGHFIAGQRDVQVEVAPKAAGDRGGIPVWADAEAQDGTLDRTRDGERETTRQSTVVRRLQVLEEFRLPKGFDAESVRVFNTNTFLARASALLDTDVQYNWFEVEKKVGDRVAVQFERLLQELTTATDAGYVRVSREGVTSRFLPVKDYDELAKRRDDIARVAAARGMLRGEHAQ